MSESEVPELTFGQKQVGVTFNPSSSPLVDNIKRHTASLIDELYDQRYAAGKDGKSGEVLAQFTLAIRAAEDASYRGVKAATWTY